MSLPTPLFTTFLNLINTSEIFKFNQSAYLTIRKYAFDFVTFNYKQNPSFLQQNEIVEIEKIKTVFLTEKQGKENLFYDRMSYESFVLEAFKPINFNNCDRNTAVIGSCLISVMSLYGDINEKYSSFQKYLIEVIKKFDEESQFGNRNNNQNIQLSPSPIVNVNGNGLAENIIMSNSKMNDFLNKNNQVNNPISNTNTNNTCPSNTSFPIRNIEKKATSTFKAKKKESVILKEKNIFWPSDLVMTGMNNGGKVNFETLINKTIKFPITKGSIEYLHLKEVIKEHLLYAEQEALFNKVDNCKAHLNVALYYLSQIQ